MAEIVKARDTRATGEPILAVKRILPHLVEDRQFVTMFLDESRVLQQLDHDQIIHTFEVGDVDGTPYIALEYVYGQDARMLFHRVRRSDENIPIPLACYIIAQVSAGLHYSHEQTDAQGSLLGLVHRDVSLQNILLSYDGEVKIIDFGIAMSAENRARTEAGIVKGKFGYMSPEQIRGEVLDRRSDVFAAGICLYELLTSQRLFSGDSDYAAIERVRNVDVQPPSSLNRQIPSSLERIVMKSLAKNPRDRYQTANEMRRALLAFMTDSHNECAPGELSEYLRTLFAEEIQKQPSAGAVTSGLGAGEGDEGTGLAAFADLDPVSMLTALEDRPVEPEPAAPLYAPEVRRDPTPTPAPSPFRGRPAGAPSVPPIVPRAHSIPGMRVDELAAHGAPPSDPGSSDAAWGDEPTTSPGLLAGVEPLPDADDNDVTKQIHVHDTFPGMAFGSAPTLPSGGPAHGRQADSSPQLVGATPHSGTFPVRPSYPPTAGNAGSEARGFAPVASVPSARGPSTVPPSAGPDPFRRPGGTNALAVLGVVGAIVAVIVVGLYLTKAPDPGTIHLSTQPKDVRVVVDGKPVDAESSPFVLANLTPETEHTISVDKDGYRPWSTRLSVRPGQTLELPVVSLESVEPPPVVRVTTPAPTAAPAQAPAPAPSVAAPEPAAPRPVRRTRVSAGGVSAPTPAPTRTTAPSRKATSTRPAPAASGGFGTLRINTRPWSQISIDGKAAGNTPQMNLRLSAGKHRVTLTNKEFGLEQTITVDVKAGETVTRVITLQ